MSSRPAVIALALLAAVCPAPALALTGHVEDPDGKPIKGARACYLLPGGAEGLCAETDKDGYYLLPESRLTALRVVAEGYLPLKTEAVPRDAPIRLEREAVLFVKLVDAATGGPIANGEFVILRPTGRQVGPLRPNAAGLRFRELPPGPIKLTANAEGYQELRGHDVELLAGRETEVVLKLKPEPASLSE